MGSMKGGGTAGFHYLFGLLWGICRGPVNDLREIRVGDKVAWEGPLCDGDVQAIKSPNLFGGAPEGEGGIQGPFRLFMGGADQVLPGAGSANCGGNGPLAGTQTLPDVKATIQAESPGVRISEFRGTFLLWFDGLISSMNPYPKQWAFRLRRHTAGWYNDECWYRVKAAIFLAAGKIQAMNPTHIIYQCLTDPVWGRGMPPALIDENSFIYAADKLCSENFGLCIAWQRKEEVDQFIAIIQDYIDCFLFPDPETGKMTIKLLRDDFVEADLPSFDPSSGLIDIQEDETSSQDEIFSEMIGQGFDPITKTEFTVRAHNLAARQSQGGPNPESRDLSGIPTRDLMGRVLQRDLKKMCSGLSKYIVVLDRAGWKLRPGTPFKVSDPRRNIGSIVLRVVEVTDQSFKDGRITLKCTEDVFALPATTYITTNETAWTPPPTEAVPAADQAIYEASYRDVLLRKSAADMAALVETNAYFGVVAASPNSAMYRFDLDSRAAGETDYTVTSGVFTGNALLAADITILQTAFNLASVSHDWPENIVGQAIVIGDEQMAVTAFDSTTGDATVKRGVADTVPKAHAAGDRVWAIDDDFVTDGRTYAEGEDVDALVLTRTNSDLLDPADAVDMTLTLVARQARPYPPAKVTVDAAEALTLAGVHNEPVIDWVSRNRLVQEDQLVGYTEAAVAAEAGTTYNLRVYGIDGVTLLRDVPGAVAPWTYDVAMQAADGNPTLIFVELESERDGLTSYQLQRFPITILDVILIDGDALLIDGETVETD
jgi:hypothetical protein